MLLQSSSQLAGSVHIQRRRLLQPRPCSWLASTANVAGFHALLRRRGMVAKTAITAADSGIGVSSGDGAVAVGAARSEREQADDLALAGSQSSSSNGVLTLAEPAVGTSHHSIGETQPEQPYSRYDSSPGRTSSSMVAIEPNPMPNNNPALGLGTASYSLPIQSWGGEDEAHTAQAAAAQAAVDAISTARAAGAAEEAAASSKDAGGADGSAGSPPSSSSASKDDPQPKAKGGGSLGTRVVFGALLGIGGAAAVAVKQLFMVVVCFITFHATQEYSAMVSSKGITRGMAPPPRIVSALTTVLCVSMVLFSYFYRGRSGTVLAVAAFFLLVMNMVAIRKPKFSMLASTLFGVFYCGWLPSFWVKLRFLNIPAPASALLPSLGIPAATWTVGLVATFTSAICIAAADIGAYFVGKTLGRTKLTDISPKKTVEGAVGGLASSVAAALALWKITLWPATPLAAAGLGVLTFFSSLFGDLIESIIKRDAGMKDSGDLIPGHGGLLDRFDSYMFTGAVTYFYILFILPYVGV